MGGVTANPDFDTYRLSEDHEAVREAVRAVAEDKIAPRAADVDEVARYPWRRTTHSSRATSSPRTFPRSTAVGADALATCIVIEEIARVCASSSLIPAVNKLRVHAADRRRERGGEGALPHAGRRGRDDDLVRPVRARGRVGHGLDAVPCGARRDDWVLTGQKSWITNAGVSRLYTVLAVTDPDGLRGNNITAFVVEEGDEGYSVGEKERKLGIKGSPTRELIFERTRIPGDRVVGEVGGGLKLALATLDHTRVTIGAQAVGIGQGALDQAVAYVQERRQFGRAVADFQGVQFMLADMAMELEAARQLVYVAAAKSERGDADLPFFGAAAKCYASDVAMKVTTDAVRLLGGAGYTRDFLVERMMRDAKITQIYEGTNQVQRVVMARQPLKLKH